MITYYHNFTQIDESNLLVLVLRSYSQIQSDSKLVIGVSAAHAVIAVNAWQELVWTPYLFSGGGGGGGGEKG